MSATWLRPIALIRRLAAAGRASATNQGARGPFCCAACGRTVAVSWPARSVLCRCGMHLLAPPPSLGEAH